MYKFTMLNHNMLYRHQFLVKYFTYDIINLLQKGYKNLPIKIGKSRR